MSSEFDEKAKTWDDDPGKRRRARDVGRAIAKTVPLGSSTRMLEYGAGTGLVSQDLADEVGAITLADTSAGMRAVIHQKIDAGTLPAGSRVWDLDLTADPPPEDRFDLVVTVLTLHHIHDIDAVLRGFATLLGDGGHLCVVDLEEEDGSFHRNSPGFDGHHGFARPVLADHLERAGLTDVRFEQCHVIEKHGDEYPVFLATSRRGR